MEVSFVSVMCAPRRWGHTIRRARPYPPVSRATLDARACCQQSRNVAAQQHVGSGSFASFIAYSPDVCSAVVGQAKRFPEEITQGVKRSRSLLKQLVLDGLRRQIDKVHDDGFNVSFDPSTVAEHCCAIP
jgi:hypothetical protein